LPTLPFYLRDSSEEKFVMKEDVFSWKSIIPFLEPTSLKKEETSGEQMDRLVA